MATSLKDKSTPDQIRTRFDSDVERFANLDTGQVATIDAPLAMELITQAAVTATPTIQRVLDIGCGAGNNTLKLLQAVPGGFACDLLDLSGPMLARAAERVSVAGAQSVHTIEADFRAAELPDGAYNVVLAAAVLHHLRDDADWEAAFAKLYRVTAPGGSVWITDLVTQETEAVQDLLWQRYGAYLVSIGGEAYRDQIFAIIDREDSPRPATYQLELLRRVGFSAVELLHKNACFAAFGAIKEP
ncbi:MAG: class I SAM-dependent methyltransferase [Chloroflexota bacterium]|jgi:tRNA (cmo5U34)-methyltransferase